MRRLFLVTVVTGFAMMAPALAPEARADHRWDGVGSVFRIGGLNFSLVFGQPFLSYPRGHYYRAERPISYRGARCSSACFRDRDVWYHHDGCPVVHGYFEDHGAYHRDVFARYAPGRGGYRDGYYDDRHYDDGYYGDRRGRHDRYDRHDRYGRHDRYDRDDRRRDDDRRRGYRGHGEYRGHGKYRGQGHDRHGNGRGRGHRHHDHDRDRCPYDHRH